MKQKMNDYREGQEMTKDSIMFLAENKYKSPLRKNGTWKFKIKNDLGTEHKILILHKLLGTAVPYHLLSPQHGGQQSKDPDKKYSSSKMTR